MYVICMYLTASKMVLRTGMSRLSKTIFSMSLESAFGERAGKLYFRAKQKFSSSCTHAGQKPFTQIVALVLSINTEQKNRYKAAMRNSDFHLQST